MTFRVHKDVSLILSMNGYKRGHEALQNTDTCSATVDFYLTFTLTINRTLYKQRAVLINSKSEFRECCNGHRGKIGYKNTYHCGAFAVSYQLLIELSAKEKLNTLDYNRFSCSGFARKDRESCIKINVCRFDNGNIFYMQ